ncbi:MAG TPA: tyrosine/phenylalanine carboxypeptidase domain-containing protein [Longimicrobiales bacterium]
MQEILLDRIARQEGTRHTLSNGGVLHIDRGLPFLFIYREPERADRGTDRLIGAEAAYLISRRGEEAEVAELVGPLARSGSAAYGAYLLLEIWSSPDANSRRFVLRAPAGPAPETIGRMVEALQPLRELRPGLEIALETGDDRHPPDLPRLLTIDESWRHEILLLGLEVPPIYRDPETGDVYPRFLLRLRQRLSRALRQAVYEFVRVQTTHKIENHLALGSRTPADAVWGVDRALCDLEHSFDLLLLTAPVNDAEAWERFRSDGFARNPDFHYRLLRFDPDLLKRRLFAIRMEAIDDPALADLMEDKRQELDTKITMLRERGTKEFRYNSLRLYGEADEALVRTAGQVLEQVGRPARWDGEWVDADGFRAAAERELSYYRTRYDGIRNTIEIRPDVTGLLVSAGNLMIGAKLMVRADRVAPLVHHEVGTHVLTFVNGSAQPLQQLSLGLAGYDELQEGLAVLAEYLAGGLDRLRMRLLAVRVIAARTVQEGADFVETFRVLRGDHGYSPAGAWSIALRVHASGGFTRDMIYLRGLIDLLDLLRNGADPAMLYIGKIAKRHLPIIEELRYREVLREPPLSPRYLTGDDARDRLDAVRRGITLTEMICPDR